MTGRSRANGEGSIYPYKNGYAAYVWVTTPSGDRKRRYVYGKDRDTVHAKWVRLHNQVNSGTTVATSSPTVAQYLAYWLEEVIRPNRAPLTYSTYEIYVRRHIVPGIGHERLHKLTPRKVQKWINVVARTCQCCQQGKDAARPASKRRCCAIGDCCDGHLDARSVSDIRACLRSALSDAMTEELLDRNPAKQVKLPRIRKKKRKRWTTDEARRFLESAKRDGDPMYAAYVLVLVLGMRKGEVLGLPDLSVDLQARELDITHQLQRVRGRLLHRETKTEASDESLPLPAIAATALQARRSTREEHRFTAGSAWHDNGLLFTTRYGTPIEPRNFLRSWESRCAKANVTPITIHDARRTCGSLLADLDVHPRVAMRILRHAKFQVTMEIYTEVSSEQTQAALKRLGESLDG